MGCDNFSPDDRWGTFWGASAGWVLSEESWMKKLDFVNLLKLRASYGETGLDSSAGRFGYLTSYTLNNQAYVIKNKYVPVLYSYRFLFRL